MNGHAGRRIFKKSVIKKPPVARIIGSSHSLFWQHCQLTWLSTAVLPVIVPQRNASVFESGSIKRVVIQRWAVQSVDSLRFVRARLFFMLDSNLWPVVVRGSPCCALLSPARSFFFSIGWEMQKAYNALSLSLSFSLSLSLSLKKEIRRFYFPSPVESLRAGRVDTPRVKFSRGPSVNTGGGFYSTKERSL